MIAPLPCRPAAAAKTVTQRLGIRIPPEVAADVARRTAEAIRERRHAPLDSWRTVCDGCRSWVSAIHYRTLDGKRLCKQCAPPEPSKLKPAAAVPDPIDSAGAYVTRLLAWATKSYGAGWVERISLDAVEAAYRERGLR